MNELSTRKIVFCVARYIDKAVEYMKERYVYFQYVKCLVLKLMYELYFRIIMKITPFYVYKVYAYPYDEMLNRIDITNNYYDGFYTKCTPSIGYPRIEYRCLWKGKKYKVNSLKEIPKREITEDVTLPMMFPKKCNVNEPCLSIFSRKKVEKYIMEACLTVRNDENANDIERIDVTQKILKFAGPNHDFFNQPMIVKWIIKNQNKPIEYSYLHIMYSNGQLSKYTMSETVLI